MSGAQVRMLIAALIPVIGLAAVVGCQEFLVALGPGFGVGGGGGGNGGNDDDDDGVDTTRRITLAVRWLQIDPADRALVGVSYDQTATVATDNGLMPTAAFTEQNNVYFPVTTVGGFAEALVPADADPGFLPIGLTTTERDAGFTAFPLLRANLSSASAGTIITGLEFTPPLLLQAFRPTPFAAEIFSAELSPADAQGVVDRLVADDPNHVLTAPPVTLFNRQAVLLSLFNEEATVADLDPNFADLGTLQLADDRPVATGPVLDLRAAIDAAGDVELTLRPGTQVVQLSQAVPSPTLGDEAVTLVTPLVRPARVSTTITVTAGQTLLLGESRVFGTTRRVDGLPLLPALLVNRPQRDDVRIRDERALLIMITPEVVTGGG